MAWKIKRKIKRDGLRILHPESDGVSASVGDVASFMADKAEPFCSTCGGDNDFYQDGPGIVWGCALCDNPGIEQ